MAKNKPTTKPTDGTQSAPAQAKIPAQQPAAETLTVGGKTIATGEVHITGNPDATPAQAPEIVTIQQTAFAISIPKETSLDAWLEIGHRIGEAMKGASWKIGDWCNFGIAVYGHKDYDAGSQATGLSEQYLRACSSIAQRVAPELREHGSIERFRLLLAMPSENKAIPEDERKGSAERAETLAEKVERLADWTMAELRNKQRRQALPPAPPATTPGKDEPTGATVAADATADAPSGSTTGVTAPVGSTDGRPSMTAEGIHTMAKALTAGLEELTPERLTLLATFEAKEGRLKPLAAMLKIAIEQIGSLK
jgi:hypothetical protein